MVCLHKSSVRLPLIIHTAPHGVTVLDLVVFCRGLWLITTYAKTTTVHTSPAVLSLTFNDAEAADPARATGNSGLKENFVCTTRDPLDT